MDEPVRFIVTRTENLPAAPCPSIPITCTKCEAPCWQSLVCKHDFHRKNITNYQAVCGTCDTTHPADLPTDEVGAALPGTPRARQFMPPSDHTLKQCTECRQPAWVELGPYLFITKYVPEPAIYCDTCLSSCPQCSLWIT